MVTRLLRTLSATVGCSSPLRDCVVERRDVGDRAPLVDRLRLAAVVEVLAADQHLPAVLGLEDALGAEHAIPDAFGPRAEAVELPRRERDPHVVGVL